MEITFWGTRGSIPVSGPRYSEFGGNTPCISIRLQSSRDVIILDSGSGIRELGLHLMSSMKDHSKGLHLFLTHAHWDHIQGFPFFVPAFVPGFSLDIYCTKDAETIFGRQMSPPFFPVNLDVMLSTKTFHLLQEAEGISVGDALVRHIPLPHPQVSTAFRVEEHGHSLVFATDTEHTAGKLNETLCELARGADVFIYDAQYTDEEYKTKVSWGHSTYTEAIKLARAAGVKQLILYSHDPTHDDATLRSIEAAAKLSFPNTIAARDGMVIHL
jgi:phosphoribosyl 1,2-cyclic phosphodiesterase